MKKFGIFVAVVIAVIAMQTVVLAQDSTMNNMMKQGGDMMNQAKEGMMQKGTAMKDSVGHKMQSTGKAWKKKGEDAGKAAMQKGSSMKDSVGNTMNKTGKTWKKKATDTMSKKTGEMKQTKSDMMKKANKMKDSTGSAIEKKLQ